MTIRTIIRGVGSYLPANAVTNAALAERVATSDEWIQERTGIQVRHIAAEGEKTSDLAIAAATRALAHAGMDGKEIDLLVVCTATPDQTFPATAARVQAALCRPGVPSFDLQAVCSGFVYGLATVDNFIRTGQYKNALLIGAETFSRILDWTDRTTCVLFGDGAGAVVVSGHEGTGKNTDRGILSTHLHSDGRHHDMLYVDGGPSSTQTTGHVRMKGKEVFRHAVVNLAEAVHEALAANQLTAQDLDWLVPHQANRRILDSTAQKLGIDPNKVVVTVGQHANTSAASIPLALDAAVKDGRIKQGNLVLMEAMGGGFTWGSALVRM